ncbi:PREDICTED: uncharacterized protein LOC109468230 [Branchiostoma belcheri]|uniref:Uncharacterized protein LOC109468230 n=1 Tax=Branchiostoma belcheri TaxID=7741 RepID=A0A6P4YXP5_BRABE|nr:PREDICTED: uncharacterized protein LOC109468230 [Branchiostoma belcheri]
MKLFVCTLLVTIVVVAMLIEDSEGLSGWRRRRRSRRSGLDSRSNLPVNLDEGPELREVLEEARDLLDSLMEKQEQLEARELQMDPEEEDYTRKRR